MSNETDLGWLARNVHNWPAGHQGWCYVISNRDGTKGVATSLIGQVDCPWVRIEKQEWLTRRVELQNKPGWADFGESAKFMAQDSDGAWMAFEIEPTAKSHVWSAMRGWCGYAREGRDRCRGEVLGDWRDTLERRPEAMAATISREILGNLGMKSDRGKPILGAIPPHAELAVGRVLTFGAEKYARGNWDHVADHDNRYMDSALRHLNAHRRGDLVDGESGESHLAHAACCILFLLDKQERAGGEA